MKSEGAGLLARAKLGVAFLAAFVAAGAANGTPLEELASDRHTFTYTSADISKILGDIKVAERHTAGEELRDILPNASSTRGLRAIDGYQNNITGIDDRDVWGAADFAFPTLADQAFRPAGTLPDMDGPMGPAVARETSYNSSTDVWDPEPRIISQLINNQTSQNPAALAVFSECEDCALLSNESAAVGLAPGDEAYAFPNAAPDEGLSAPINSFITFFGQFFDHGLDLIEKGGNGTVMIPLQEDDPLYVEGSQTNFMSITRATQVDGQPGSSINRTAPLVDQNQTYASHPSVLVFLRDYELVDGMPEATGRLLNGAPKAAGDEGGMATWAEVKENARTKLGIELDDFDGKSMPLIAVDAYGHFLPGPNGLPMIVTEGAVDAHRHHGIDYVTTVEGDLVNPVDASDAVRTHQDQLIDIAHGTDPFSRSGTPRIALSTATVGQCVDIRGESTCYDDELLGTHYVTGDGRSNENIALTAIHHIFHSEHNRLVEFSKAKIVKDAFDNNDLAGLNEWLDTAVDAVPDPSVENDLDWDGNRMFSLAKFGTEMQYNRIAFDEFSPTLAGLKDPFEGGPFGYHTNLDPTITMEFAQSVYRFGHSLLTEDVFRFSSGLAEDNSMSLFDAFLNPSAFDMGGSMTDDEAAGSIIRGATRDTANELDEFVTPALQTNLLGLPLDLGAINIARGRDVGLPRLNAARRSFYAATGSTQLQPYKSWMDFADNLTHEGSLVNFVAAYGTHDSVTQATTFDGRRSAAQALVDGLGVAGDARDFLYSHGVYANREGLNVTGVEDIDFWVGGLAEERMPFGGYLGSTFNYVFESQMEGLQNGDRFYYLARTGEMDLLNELESNSFTRLVMRNSDAGEVGSGSMHLNIFASPNHILEIDQTRQRNPGSDTSVNVNADPDPESMLFPLVIRDADFLTTDINIAGGNVNNVAQYTGGDHVVIGGTNEADTIIGGIGDDALWGHGGNDRIEGGDGADLIEGGDGDDIITDLAGPDVIEGGRGNDAIHSGNEEDVIFGDEGNDFIINSSEHGETFLGDGNDFLFDGPFLGLHRGGAGHDWMENTGGGEVVLAGDLFAFQELGESPVKGHDILVARGGNNDMDAESGDDIMVDGPGVDRMEGQMGFDWASFQNDELGVEVDIATTIFLRPVHPPSNATMENRYDRVEGISGSPKSDILIGTENPALAMIGNELFDTLDLIDGLLVNNNNRRTDASEVGLGVLPASELREIAPDFFNPATGPRVGWAQGEIILGGAGSDLMEGKNGDDIIDGDKSLHVGIDTGDGRIVDSMMDIQAEVFAGTLPVANLVASRAIADRDENDVDTDTVVFSGNRADYVIEGTTNADGVLTIEDIQQRRTDDRVRLAADGYIRVTDQALGALGDGSDLVRNVERLRFNDEVVVIPAGVAGAGGAGNSVATGAPVIAGEFTVGGTVTAALGTLADADGMEGPITWMWQVELEVGSGEFSPLMVITPNAPFQLVGESVVLDAGSAGLNIRVAARFKDDAGVFEQGVSAAAQVECDAACVAALPVDMLVPVATVQEGRTCDNIRALDIVFENASRAGRPRLDFVVANVLLNRFDGTESAFPPGFGAGAELAVNNVALVFTDANGVVNGTVSPEITAIEQLDAAGAVTGVSANRVNILWSIRGADVAPLVMGDTTVDLVLNGVACASIPLVGNSGILDGTDVTQVAVDGVGVVLTPEAPPVDPVTVDPVAPEAPTSFSATTPANGRVRINDTCPAGSEATADTAGVACATDAAGRFRCRGRGVPAATVVTATCSEVGGGVDAAPSSTTVAADARGLVRETGNCFAGQTATAAGLRCRTSNTGRFTCTGRDFAAGEEVVITCQ